MSVLGLTTTSARPAATDCLSVRHTLQSPSSFGLRALPSTIRETRLAEQGLGMMRDMHCCNGSPQKGFENVIYQLFRPDRKSQDSAFDKIVGSAVG